MEAMVIIPAKLAVPSFVPILHADPSSIVYIPDIIAPHNRQILTASITSQAVYILPQNETLMPSSFIAAALANRARRAPSSLGA